MERDCDKEIMCVVSPSPRAERRFTDEDMIDVFTAMGTIMKKLTRFEAHFYSSNHLWLHAKALTGFVRNAVKVERFLLNGVRIKGTDLDLVELGEAIQRHPSFREVTFFNIGPHRQDDGHEACLKPMLEGVSRNRNAVDLTLRFVSWSNPFLQVLTDEKSNIPSLRLSGKETVYGPEGDGINMGAPNLLEALYSNTALREIRINQCATPVGLGEKFGAMLRANKHLRKLFLHVISYEECIPIGEALATANHTLTHLELFVEDPRKRGVVDIETMRPDINRAVEVFEESMATNPSLKHVKLFCRGEIHNTPKMDFYTRMNLAGRFKVITNDSLTPEQALAFVSNHNSDHSMMFYILGMKPSVMQLCMQAARDSRKVAKKPVFDEYFSDDDDLPISVLARRKRQAADRKSSSKKAMEKAIEEGLLAQIKRRRLS